MFSNSEYFISLSTFPAHHLICQKSQICNRVYNHRPKTIQYTPMSEVFEGAIGIDLGTTYSCVAVWDTEQRVEILQNEQGSRTTASYVAFTAEERLIGDAAKNQAAMNPKNTVFDAKRLIGRRFDDKDVQKDMESWPFKVVDDESNSPLIEVEFQGETKKFSPQEISSMVLLKMKEIAEAKLGKTTSRGIQAHDDHGEGKH
ncbi:HSP70-domain-containing protein [Ramicandelaber brevisporus]|nr:HSP70-domain-containing protein [Ramicandelaber brevisporus]